MTHADTHEQEPIDALLDLGISTAFRRAAAGGGELQARPTEAEPAETLPGEIGRYTLHEVLGQGGMGIVVRAHDRELDRDVAVKLLRRALASPDLEQRFRAEAQVMAGLEHPGIVPVHDIGKAPGGQIYTVMRRIGGESLHAQLRRRRERGAAGADGSERNVLLSHFARICETVAFAHSRGVVHGDLKPANVMLGAFGEVQVLDWGLARAARAACAEPGPRVAGTPAYMAPEQARAAAESIGPRTDVFGLGGILCELLTGAPPYRGATEQEVYLRAARAWLDDAHARLDSSGSDPALVALARRCLAADPAQRPDDAAAVAAAVRQHLATLEQRAQTLALEAAAARVRAAEERKARRLAVLLSAVVVLALAAGTGVWLWLAQREAQLRDGADQRLRAAQTRIAEARQRARETGQDKARHWSEATAVAREAIQLARTPLGSDGLRHDLERLATATELEAERQLRDEHVLASLDELRPHQGDDRTLAEVDAEHHALLALFAVAIDDDPPERVAAAFQDSPLAARIALALHHWAHQRRARGGENARWRRLLEHADRIDPDPWRQELRRRCGSGDAAGLRELAARPEPAAEAGSLGLLGECLAAAGDLDEAIRVYRMAHVRQPGDYGVVHDLASLLERAPVPPRDEIARLFTAALALRPQSPHVLADLATALLEAGEATAAGMIGERALATKPDYARAWHCRVALCTTTGDRAGAVEAARRALALQPGSVKAHRVLAIALLRAGLPAEARQVCADAVALAPASEPAWSALGEAQMELGFLAAAIETLRHAALLDGQSPAASYSLGVALQRAEMAREAEAAYRRTLALAPHHPEAHCNLGLLLQRRGQLDEALELLRKGEELGRRRMEWTEPSAQWIESVEHQVALLPVLERVAAGEAAPDAPEAVVQLALLALARGEALLALRLFEDAYSRGRFVGSEYLDVVRAAAQVAAADPEAPTPTARQRAWASRLGTGLLGRVLADLRQRVEAEPATIPATRTRLEAWLLMPELARLREPGTGLGRANAEAWARVLDGARELLASLRER